MSQKPSGWSIKTFYKEAWRLVKTHKVLWLFGIAAGASTSFNFSGNNLFDPDSMQKFFHSTPQSGSDSVLGDSTSVIFENLSYLFSAVPMWVYVLLALEVIVLIVIMIGLTLVFQNWATALLLDGVSGAIRKRPVSIKSSSERGFVSIVPLMKVTLVPYLILGASALLLFGLLSVGLSLASSAVSGLFGFLMAIGVIVFIVAFVLLTLTLIWAVRFVVIDHASPKSALSHGFLLTKAHFWRMLGLGIVNLVVSILAFVIPVAILVGVFAAGFLTLGTNKSLGGSILGIGGILVVLFILAIQLLSGIMTAFKATVWSLAYNVVHKKHD